MKHLEERLSKLADKLDKSKVVYVSEVPALFGMDKYRSPHDVFLRVHGRMIQKPETDAQKLGTCLEGGVLDFWCQKNGYDVLESQVSLSKPYLRGKADAIVQFGPNKYLVEVKTTAWNLENYLKAANIQLQTYLALSGIDVGKVVFLTIDGQLAVKEFEYRRDDVFEQILADVLFEFYQEHVIPDNPPKEHWTNPFDVMPVKDKEILCPPGLELMLLRYQEMKNRVEELEKQLEELKGEIAREIGDAEVVKTSDGKKLATFKLQSRGYLDTKKLIEELKLSKEELSKYQKETVFRVLRVYS